MSFPGLAEQLDAVMRPSGSYVTPGGVFSLTLATVKNIKDEQNLNRVRCLPIGAPDEELTDWCYVMSPMGGAESGLFLFPQVGDLVVLGYLENDPHRPIVLGSFWSTESAPPLKVEDGKSEDYCLKTPNQIKILLHDEEKKQKLTVTMPSGSVLEIDDESKTLTAKDSSGDTALVMLLKDGEIELKAKNKLTLSAGRASVTLEKNGNVTIKGGEEVALDGKSVSAKAQGQLTLQGMDVSAKANKDLNLNATATASLKGMFLKLN